MSFFNYKRRPTIDVKVGNIFMGGNYPVVIQTMTNTNTLDTEGSVAQCERIIASGADLIRLTTQGVREANNLKEIHQQLRDKGYNTPLSAATATLSPVGNVSMASLAVPEKTIFFEISISLS
jgi:(E)-4-hydroxy-3-methylbut-2-enyl-diphosphate synthase